jgi:hypothetical protein
MDNKLKKLAIKLKNYVQPHENGVIYPQGVFNKLSELFKSQKDYFSFFTPNDFIKLSFYIYSYKTTGNFDLAEQMLNNITFIGLFYTSNNKSILTCDHCGGDGYIKCGDCYGNGNIVCNRCDSGVEDYCSECYEDEINCTCEDGFSPGYCSNCGGDQEIECPSCGGSGDDRCEFCDGNGEIESEDMVSCSTFNVLTWNRELILNSELRDGEPIPVADSNDHLKDTIFLDFFDVNLELGFELESDMLYCYDINDEPKLLFDSRFHIKILNRDKLSKFSA